MEDDRSSLPFSLNGVGHYQQIPLGLLLGKRFDRADALLIYFRFVISFLSGRFARSAFKEVSFRADQMHCSLDFHFVI